MKNWILGLALLGVCAGCVSADISKPTTRVDLDDESMDGGISSSDIRMVATRMCPAILTVPEIADGTPPVRIKFSDMKNSSRFFIDRNLFMKRLSVELNRYANGQVRFLSGNANANAARAEALTDRQDAQVRKELAAIAKDFAASPLVAHATTPIKIAVIPVLNANMVNMNADSFAAMLRSEIVSAAGGKVQFLMPGETAGADYWLTGQFYPESLTTEGMINLAEYISVIDARVKDGKSLYIEGLTQTVTATDPVVTIASSTTRESVLLEMLRNPAMRAKPNVNKIFNMMIVRPADKVSVFEKTVAVDRKISTNAGAANYILSGEISGLTQSAGGKTSDYLLISLQLVDLESNEVIWEDAYEVKRVSKVGAVYR